MRLRGILDRSLSNQLCIRGFAPIKHLASISEADYSYQRNLYEEQEEIVKDFLENEKYLFFPEIILSYKFRFIGDVTKNPFLQLKDFERQTKSFKIKSNRDRTIFNVKRLTYSADDLRGRSTVFITEIDIEDELIADIGEHGLPRLFHRIDGNHRLTVAENSESTKVDSMIVPYCIILGEEYSDESNNVVKTEESEEFDKSIVVYFHNINTKSLALTSEQNLSIILNPNGPFTESEINHIFPNSGTQVRELIKHINPDLLTGISHILDERFLEIINGIFETINTHLSPKRDEEDLRKTIEAIKAVEQEYLNNLKLKANPNDGLFTALTYYKYKNTKQYKGFLDWILSNHLFDVREAKAATLIEIYDKIFEKKTFQLFVAMPYYSHKEVTEYNKLFKEICSDVSQKAKIELQLIPIMRFRGKSQRIDQRLLDWIDKCDIFVADITGNNLNVIFEIAYADGKGKPLLLIKNESDEVQAPFDMDKLQYIPFANKGYYNDIKSIAINNLLAILRDDFHIQI